MTSSFDKIMKLIDSTDIHKVYFDPISYGEMTSSLWISAFKDNNTVAIYEIPKSPYIEYRGMHGDPEVIKKKVKLPKININEFDIFK